MTFCANLIGKVKKKVCRTTQSKCIIIVGDIIVFAVVITRICSVVLCLIKKTLII